MRFLIKQLLLWMGIAILVVTALLGFQRTEEAYANTLLVEMYDDSSNDFYLYTLNVAEKEPKRFLDKPIFDAEIQIQEDGWINILTYNRSNDFFVYRVWLDGSHLQELMGQLSRNGYAVGYSIEFASGGD